MKRVWGPALRIARRSVRRRLGRSILIVTLVAVPIAAATVADGIIRTRIDPDVMLYNEMGTADAIVSIPDSVDIADVLPAGSRAKVRRNSQWLPVRLAAGDRRVQTEVHIAEAGDPLTEHAMRLKSGRLPRAADEVLVSALLAAQLDLLAGEQLRPAATAAVLDGPTVRVTGVIDYRICGGCNAVVVAPGSVLAGLFSSVGTIQYAVDLPAGTSADQLRDSVLTLKNADLTTRESYTAPWTFGEYVTGVYPLLPLYAGLGLLEIVLLAGAAFAVGARRQVRELGLIAANGGTATQLSTVMLVHGLVLGVLGAISGVLLGAIVAVLGMPLWRSWFPTMSDELRFGWSELTVAASAGVLACVVAAVLPAIGAARMRPIDTLAGRFRATSATARLPVLGLVLLLVGGAGLVATGIVGRIQVDNIVRFGSSVEPTSIGLVAGATIMALGLILVIPALMAVAGRLGARLPLSGRLAVRDASRHRYRTVAAVAAVMIAVAGAVATAFEFEAEAHDPKSVPDHAIYLGSGIDIDDIDGAREQLDWAVARLTDKLPDAEAHHLVTFVPDGGSQIYVGPPPSVRAEAQCRWEVLGSPEMMSMSAGRAPDAPLRAALDAGKVVVFDECLVSPTGTVRSESAGSVELPAYVAERPPGAETYEWMPGAFISERTAETHGWPSRTDTVVVTYAATADQNVVKKEFDIVTAAGVHAVVEEDDSAGLGGSYLLLAGAAALIALLGVAITAALSAAEGRADMATLAALGAQPHRRRALAGAHALVISGLGTLLGLLLGGCVGYGVIPLGYGSGFAVPWQLIGLTTIGVPCVAVMVAMLTTRSRLPMIRRRGS